MALEDRHTWPGKKRGPGWFQDLIDDIYDTITEVQPLSGLQTSVSETNNGRQIDLAGGGEGGAGGGEDQHYEFQCTDASDGDGAKVLIFDGFVYGPNDDGNYPDGMTGLDDFIAGPFADAATEVWLEIWVDFDSWDVTSININWGSSTPEDNDTTIFVTIAFVGVDWDPDTGIGFVFDISNAIAGDYTIDPGLGVLGADDTGTEVDIDHVNQINFLGACTVEHDLTDPNPNSVDINIGPDLEFDDDAGVQQAVDKVEVIGFWGAVSGTQDTSDPDVVDVDLTFGEDLTGDDGSGGTVTIDKCEVMNFIGAVRLQEDTSDPDVTAANVIVGMFIDDGGGVDEYDDIWGLRFQGATLTLIEPGYLRVVAAGSITAEWDNPDGSTHTQPGVTKVGFFGAVDGVVDSGDPSNVDFTFGTDIETDAADGTPLNVDKVMVLGFWGAVSGDQDTSDPDVIDVDLTFGEDLTGDDGTGAPVSIDKVELMNFIGAVKIAPNTSDPDVVAADLTFGMFIDDGGGIDEFDDIWGLQFPQADLTLIEPGYLKVETGGIDIETDDLGATDNVKVLGFFGAVDASLDTSGGFNDVDLTFGTDVEFDNALGVETAVDKVMVMGFFGGVVGSQDTSDPDVIDVDFTFGLDVQDDQGNSVDLCALATFIGAVGVTADTSDPGVNAVNIKIGLDVQDDAGADIDPVGTLDFVGAVTVGDEGADTNGIHTARVKIGMDVQDDTGTDIDPAGTLDFVGAVTVVDEGADANGIHTANVIVGIEVDSDTESFEDIWGIKFPGADVSLDGAGFAIVDVGSGGVDVQGSEGSFVSGATQITFKVASDPSANYITCYNGAGIGEAVAEIPLIPATPGGFNVLVDDDGDTHWGGTETCDCSVNGGGP